MKYIITILLCIGGVAVAQNPNDSLYKIAPKSVFTFDSTAYFAPEEVEKESEFLNIIRHYDSLLYLKLLPTGDFKVLNKSLLQQIFAADKKSEHLTDLARVLHRGFVRKEVEFYEYTYERPVFFHHKTPIGVYALNPINENLY